MHTLFEGNKYYIKYFIIKFALIIEITQQMQNVILLHYQTDLPHLTNVILLINPILYRNLSRAIKCLNQRNYRFY